MAGLTPASTTNFEPGLLDRLTLGIGTLTNGETITIPQNRQIMSGPISLEDGEIDFRSGSEIYLIS